MNRLADADPLAQALRRLVGAEAGFRPPAGEVRVESLPASRQVLRFTFPAGDYAVVGKFFSAYPPQASADLSLAREYDHYLRLPGLGLGNGGGLVPRLLGRWPERSLGLLLEAVPGPDLDHLLLRACVHGDPAPLFRALEKLAHLLAFFHSRPVPADPVAPEPALAYLDKVMAQLLEAGLLTREDWQALAHERACLGGALPRFFRPAGAHSRRCHAHQLSLPQRSGRGPGPGAAASRRPPLGPVLGGRGTETCLGLAHRGF